tara:strand:+ start:3505 stop:4638 length:1134 start_codon:yes stop_codon:yes gene_type:complete
LKILIVVNVDWFFISHRLPIALEAKRKGYEVHIATKISSLTCEKILVNHGLQVHNLSFDRSGKSFWNLNYVFLQILLLLFKIKPDILHLVTIQPILLGGIAARLIGTKKIIFAISGLGHTFLSKNLTSLLRRFFIVFLYRLALKHRNRFVIFQNPHDLELISKECSLSNSEVAIIYGSGVNLNKFIYSELPKGIPVVLMASRLLESKGVYEFIKASEILKQKGFKVKFQLAGKPDKSNPLAISESEIKNWVQDGIIEYLGFKDKMEKIIPNAHIVVLPSYYPEGLPKILCEAAACGRAIITTNQPGCKIAIQEGQTGLLIKAKQEKELAKAIIKLIENKELLYKMSLSARIRAENFFNIDLIVKKHIEIYQHLHELP